MYCEKQELDSEFLVNVNIYFICLIHYFRWQHDGNTIRYAIPYNKLNFLIFLKDQNRSTQDLFRAFYIELCC